jgi:hypothetical protein
LPERVRVLTERAAAIEYPIEAVLEMAIASFLDTKALNFAGCLLFVTSGIIFGIGFAGAGIKMWSATSKQLLRKLSA